MLQNNFSDSILTKKGWVGVTKDSAYAALGGIEIIPSKKFIVIKKKKAIIQEMFLKKLIYSHI